MKVPLIVICLLLLITAKLNAEIIDPQKILEKSDEIRGGNVPGIELLCEVSSKKDSKNKGTAYTIHIKADSNNTLATFTDPPRSKGIKMLISNRNMWFLSPDVSKPVPISPRQRLLGDASNGDIATTSLSRDYNAKFLRADSCNGRMCEVLELTAKNKNVTYDKIIYFVDKHTFKGLKAEYCTASGKLLKTATFEYGNEISYKERKFNYVSRLVIRSQIESSVITELMYSNIKIVKHPQSIFMLANIDR